MSGSKQLDVVVTCASCEYRYPAVRDFCPMCGEVAPRQSANLATNSPVAVEEIDQSTLHGDSIEKNESTTHKQIFISRSGTEKVSETEDQFEDGGTFSVAYSAEEPRRRYLFPALIVFCVVVAVVVLVLVSRPRQSGPHVPAAAPAQPAVTSPANQPAPDRSATDVPPPPPVVTKHSAPDRTLAAENEVPEAANLPDNPEALWQQVRKGNTRAEVALAQLYIGGNKVDKNCEEAILLLKAASRKGNGTAKRMLEGGSGSCH